MGVGDLQAVPNLHWENFAQGITAFSKMIHEFCVRLGEIPELRYFGNKKVSAN